MTAPVQSPAATYLNACFEMKMAEHLIEEALLDAGIDYETCFGDDYDSSLEIHGLFHQPLTATQLQRIFALGFRQLWTRGNEGGRLIERFYYRTPAGVKQDLTYSPKDLGPAGGKA